MEQYSNDFCLNNPGVKLDVTKSTRSEELAKAHWENYVKGLLEATGVDEYIIRACGFVYVSTFVHGYKHAMQDVENSKKVFSEYKEQQ